ncbi:unnamed protein product [Orchesella dallaii]|uniref:Uncharacterized protein n=1 Tax=Orchesella dallaii TaxID=48710 RepID=A0ABP1RAL7_9HEXA
MDQGFRIRLKMRIVDSIEKENSSQLVILIPQCFGFNGSRIYNSIENENSGQLDSIENENSGQLIILISQCFGCNGSRIYNSIENENSGQLVILIPQCFGFNGSRIPRYNKVCLDSCEIGRLVISLAVVGTKSLVVLQLAVEETC